MNPSHLSDLSLFEQLQADQDAGRVRHCGNFDPEYPGCRECPGMVMVKQADGRVDTLCRAGEAMTRRLLQGLPMS